VFLLNPSGLFDPVWCSNSRWINTIAVITNGIQRIQNESVDLFPGGEATRA
jgi:hypothetical protein